MITMKNKSCNSKAIVERCKNKNIVKINKAYMQKQKQAKLANR